MSAPKGMTADEVDQMGLQIEDAGTNAREIYEQALSRLQELNWTGDDRDRFLSEFEGTVGQQVTQIQQRATQFKESAMTNAQQQRETSGQ